MVFPMLKSVCFNIKTHVCTVDRLLFYNQKILLIKDGPCREKREHMYSHGPKVNTHFVSWEEKFDQINIKNANISRCIISIIR